MKKGLVVLLSAVLLLFTACDSWMQDDDFYSEIENDVKVANAQQISVYVRYALTRQGNTDPDGSATFKVEIPHEISATTEPEYGFVRWAAFPTSFLATGDNQAKNKDVYFIDDDDYKARLLPHEILAPVVVFENAKSASTKVTINEKRDDIFLVPIVAQRPAVSLTIPAKGSSGVVRNMSVRINFTKPMDPDSFKNEAGEYDKITITQGIQTFSADGDIEINSQDITDRFEAPVFSANQKMVTLRFKQEAIEEGYASQSSVNIIISKDVKDIFGFNMTDDDKISFSVGSSMDTLAPRITFLTAGSTLENFDSFKGMYKDASTWNNITAFTKMDPHKKGSDQNITYLGAKDAPVNNLDSSFYDTFAPPADASNSGYRVTNKIYIHTLAEDIAGSGSNQSQTGLETDVAMLGIRATLMYKADGTVPEEAVTAPTTSVNYMPQSVGQSLAKDYVYKNLVHAINVKNGATSASDEGYLAEDKGFLFEYDLSSLPDGLIRVDIFAVDMVQNSGLAAGGELSEEYGNGYASLFVVKDTTPPDAAANSGYVIVDTGADSHITADNYFNEVTYPRLKIKSDTSSIVDSGHPRLRSHHDNMKWIVKPTDKTDWVSSIKTTDSSWGAITSNYGPFPTPEASQQGKIFYTYALMDDVGNISNAVGINPIYYDSVAPAVQTPYFVADEGFTAGVAKDNVLNEQTLVIPITEITSGLKSIEVKVRKNGAAADYATPLAADSLNVVAKDKDGNTVPYTVDSAKKVITFNQPITDFDSNVTIKGLKLSDDLDEQGSFEIKVLVKDAAAADSVHETVPVEGAVSNTDSVPVQINTVYIPNIRKTERFGVANSAEFWIDYNASTLTKKAGSNPLTDVYITFQEATSGAKVFDFTNSTISLTGDSMIYKVNASTGAIDGIAIPSTVSGNKLTITSSVDAKNNFANPDGDHKLTVKITNVALANEGTASSVNLKIYDTATNGSTAGTTICSNEGSLNLTTPGISTAGFKFDSAAPASEMAEDALCDRDGTESDSTATEASGKTTAELGYTNENLINASVTLNPRASGISSLRIDGDATFVSGTTTIKADGTDVSFDISSEGKVVTFKNANGHLALGSGTTAVTLTITNLKLTSGDGTKNVKFLARGFGNVEDSVGSTKSITLDTQAPQWIDNGLYAAAHNNVSSEGVYPHSISDGKAYGLAGIDSTNPAELYFYRRYYICIKPDVSDDNLKDAAALIDYTHDGVAVDNNNAAYAPGYALNGDGYTTQTGTFTATAKDKAGNKSTVKTFHIVEDTSFATDTEKSAIDQYMVLYKPEGAFIHRNKTVTSGEAITEYVIKGDAQYQIRVKLNGASTEEGEETIDKPGTGATQLLTDSYSRKDNTTTSSKIEYYSISVSNYVSDTPTSPSSSDWKAYTADSVSQTYTTNGITSYVNNGTIIINIPNTGSNPLVLWLKDACGNYTHRKIRPTAMAASGSLSAIRWLVDTEIGVTGYKGSLDTSLPSVTKKDDVTFYNDDNTPTFTISGLSESCRFEIGENETVTNVGDENHYSLKSRIIVWTGSGSPTRDDFYADSLTSDKASAWDYRKEAPVEQASLFNGSTDFSVSNTFPKYASSNRYKLFFILEDTVGNYYISQLKRDGSNLTTASSYTTAYWLYDNEAPVVDESSIAFQKVNQVTVGSEVRNYYSGNSTVTYNITDSGSGICHDGSGTTSYSGFDSRRTAITPKTYTIPSVSDGSAPSLSGIKDYAENTRTSITLTNGTSSKWYYRNSAPELTGTTSSNKAWAEKTSTLGYVNNTLGVDSETGGQILSLKAKSSSTSLNVYLTVTDSEKLLGWKITQEKLTLDGTECYTEADVTELPATYDSSLQQYTYTYDGYNKGFMNYESWTDSSLIVQKQYFYPVNRAGLVGAPLKVEFVRNNKPAIENGKNTNGYTYSSNIAINSEYLTKDAPSTAYTIKAGTETPKINYTREGAKVTFTTQYTPDSCKVIYKTTQVHDNQWNVDYEEYDAETIQLSAADGPTYTIDLTSALLKQQTSSAAGKPLKIQLSRGTEEDSDVYELKGPAGNNLWVYDGTNPTISFTPASDIKSGSTTLTDSKEYNGTYYITNETANITLTVADPTESLGTGSSTVSLTGSGIEHYQWRWKTASQTSYNSWRDFATKKSTGIETSADISTFTPSTGVLTFNAPEEKTKYEFRVIDFAGNISIVTSEVQLQRDDAAPTGTLPYSTGINLITPGLDTSAGTKTRRINYSSDSSLSSYVISEIDLNLSNITDDVSGIVKSGIQKFVIIKEYFTNDELTETSQVGTPTTILYTNLPSDKHTSISLSGNVVNRIYKYTVDVYDNINQHETLMTFITQSDNQAPGLPQPTVDCIKATASDGEIPAVSYNDIFWVTKDKAVITFTTTAALYDDKAYYRWSHNGTTWYDANSTNLPEGETASIEKDAEHYTITYTFTALDSATYYFQAEDLVGNKTTTAPIVLRKDAAKPTGTFQYKLKKSGGYATTADGIYTDPGESTTRTIVYKAGTVTGLELDFSNLTDEISGIEGYYLKEGEHNPVALTSDTTPSLGETNKLATITLATEDNVSKTYVVSVKDNAGNERTLQTITIISDATKPKFKLATSDIVSTDEGGVVYQDGTSPYYINGNNAIISFTKTDADIDIKRYEWKKEEDTEWKQMKTDTDASTVLTENGNSIKFQFPASVDETTYNFRAIDNVGNSASVSVSLVKDVTAPIISSEKPVSYTPKKGNAGTTENEDYIASETEGVNTFIYNPDSVDNLVFDFSGVSDGENGSGIQKIIYRTGNPETDTTISDNTVSLKSDNTAVNATYKIIAIDNVGKEKLLKTLVLKSNTPAPTAIVQVKYKNVEENHVSDNSYSASFTPKVVGVNGGNALLIPGNATFKISMDTETVLENKMYYAVVFIEHVEGNLPDISSTEPATWTLGDVAATGDDAGKLAVTVNASDLPGEKNYIFIWLKDILGNKSVYGLAYKGTANWQSGWWTKDTTGPTGNITLGFKKNDNNEADNKYKYDSEGVTIFNGNVIKNVTVSGKDSLQDSGCGITSKKLYYRVKGATGEGADGTEITNTGLDVSGLISGSTYEIFAKDDLGNQTVFKKISPDKTAPVVSTGTPEFFKEGSTTAVTSGYTSTTENGVTTFTYNTQLKIFKDGIAQSDSDPDVTIKKIVGETDKGDYNGEIQLSLQNGQSANITIKAYDKVYNEITVASYVFTANDTITLNANIGFIRGTGANEGSGDSSESRVTQLFNSVANVFARNSEATADTSVTEKPADVAKKAAKKAKKSAKKAGSKAAKKTTAKTPAVEKPVMTVETAEIVEQTVTVTVPEITSVTESVVNELTEVTEKVRGESEVVTIAPAAESSAEVEAAESTVNSAEASQKKSPSRSASIVIMLAILSSFGGMWYYKKGRKE